MIRTQCNSVSHRYTYNFAKLKFNEVKTARMIDNMELHCFDS